MLDLRLSSDQSLSIETPSGDVEFCVLEVHPETSEATIEVLVPGEWQSASRRRPQPIRCTTNSSWALPTARFGKRCCAFGRDPMAAAAPSRSASMRLAPGPSFAKSVAEESKR